jgi:RNA polymerase primary sigma factor
MEDVSHDGSHQSALETYLEELESITDLPRDLELKLFHMAADGDKEAGGTLVSRYLNTACDLAGEFEGKGLKVETEDLIQEANLGLLMAVNELEREESLAAYRVRLLNRVTTYLEERVREMEEELRGESKVVSRMNRLAQSVHELEEQLEHKPSIEELSAYLDLTTQEIRDLLRVGGEKLTIEDI